MVEIKLLNIARCDFLISKQGVQWDSPAESSGWLHRSPLNRPVAGVTDFVIRVSLSLVTNCFFPSYRSDTYNN